MNEPRKVEEEEGGGGGQSPKLWDLTLLFVQEAGPRSHLRHAYRNIISDEPQGQGGVKWIRNETHCSGKLQGGPGFMLTICSWRDADWLAAWQAKLLASFWRHRFPEKFCRTHLALASTRVVRLLYPDMVE